MTLSNIGHVAPSPDYSIAHEGSQGVMIECSIWRSDVSVLRWITAERGGKWEKPLWFITENGEKKEVSNPHKNSHQLWAYLVRKV